MLTYYCSWRRKNTDHNIESSRINTNHEAVVKRRKNQRETRSKRKWERERERKGERVESSSEREMREREERGTCRKRSRNCRKLRNRVEFMFTFIAFHIYSSSFLLFRFAPTLARFLSLSIFFILVITKTYVRCYIVLSKFTLHLTYNCK